MINKVGAIILKDKKILAVRKVTRDDRPEFIIPGGRVEGNEENIETLIRELKEELSVDILQAEYFGYVDDIAIFEQVPIHIEIYYTTIKGEPVCDNEIKEFIWVDRDYLDKGIMLSSTLKDNVIPKLIELGKM